MFDYVEGLEIDCPHCGKKLNDFQSKDGECFCTTINFTQVNNFYTGCDCGAWIEFNLIVPKDRTIKDYEMAWRKPHPPRAEGN